ncbi:exosortase F system-associated membrane protein [Fulvivirga lutimaris]|uniref:exosortase F system-associated membrane protein n=1 Tax=Fulvivirga lutimaris TaxID=1819566 RepID=UPI0012BBC9E9|nr:exosortase F system-associated protein [Fulvivirga lutimaris]MTI38858.1 exosortase F system-associated protein [Fulvivirga lutimaris]
MKRHIIIAISIVGLVLVYLFQRDIQSFFNQAFDSKYVSFALARSTRFVINDLLVVLLIYGLFGKRKYVIFALYVQIAGIALVLIPYLIIKYYTSYNGPLVSYMHRLIVNPLLMLLLIPAFYYQNNIAKNE